MARLPTPPDYHELISTLVAQGDRGERLIKQVQDWARDQKRTDYPERRQIYIIAAKARKLPPEVLQQQARFVWPRSMELGLLPWEASRVVLDFVRLCDETAVGPPTFRQCKWFWRLHLAAPTMAIGEAAMLAMRLAANEYLLAAQVGKAEISDLTRYLAYAPWESEEKHRAFAATGAPAASRCCLMPTRLYRMLASASGR